MPAVKLTIDLAEHFPQLSRAPITEAVLEIRARAEVPWDEPSVVAQIKERLPEYPRIDPRRSVEHTLNVEHGKPPAQALRDLGWIGARASTTSGAQIAQFDRDAFSFSRLPPYENWNNFFAEARRLWRIHLSYARASQIQRVGLRFINKIALPAFGVELSDYLVVPPQPPRGLPLAFAGFFSQDKLVVPESQYAINLIRTTQPSTIPGEGAFLILDADVATTIPIGVGEDELDERVAEMRWLKNKLFFGSLTEKIIERLK